MTDIEYALIISSIDNMKYKKDFIKTIRDNLDNYQPHTNTLNKYYKYFKIISKAYLDGGNLTVPNKINNKFDKMKIRLLQDSIKKNKSAEEINELFEYVKYVDTSSSPSYSAKLSIYDIEKLFLIFTKTETIFNINIKYRLIPYFNQQTDTHNTNILIFLKHLELKHHGSKFILLQEEIKKYEERLLSIAGPSNTDKLSKLTDMSDLTNKSIKLINKFLNDHHSDQ